MQGIKDELFFLIDLSADYLKCLFIDTFSWSYSDYFQNIILVKNTINYLIFFNSITP